MRIPESQGGGGPRTGPPERVARLLPRRGVQRARGTARRCLLGAPRSGEGERTWRHQLREEELRVRVRFGVSLTRLQAQEEPIQQQEGLAETMSPELPENAPPISETCSAGTAAIAPQVATSESTSPQPPVPDSKTLHNQEQSRS